VPLKKSVLPAEKPFSTASANNCVLRCGRSGVDISASRPEEDHVNGLPVCSSAQTPNGAFGYFSNTIRRLPIAYSTLREKTLEAFAAMH
jgi:hypothetical protein